MLSTRRDEIQHDEIQHDEIQHDESKPHQPHEEMRLR